MWSPEATGFILCLMQPELRAVPVLGLCLSLFLVGVNSSTGATDGDEIQAAKGILRVGTIENPAIKESSGIVASRKHPGVFWTHNDGGGPHRQILYAMTRQGKSLAEFPVIGVAISDWEDLALGESGSLYVADVGNNQGKRETIFVHEVEEPDPKESGGPLRPCRTWPLRFPGKPFDCESLFVLRNVGYVISKVFDDQQAELYRFPLAPVAEAVVLERVAPLPITSPVTGADVSADGKLLGVVCKAGAYVFRLDGDVVGSSLLEVWHRKFRKGQIEGCCFVADGLLASSESREIFLFADAPVASRP